MLRASTRCIVSPMPGLRRLPRSKRSPGTANDSALQIDLARLVTEQKRPSHQVAHRLQGRQWVAGCFTRCQGGGCGELMLVPGGNPHPGSFFERCAG